MATPCCGSRLARRDPYLVLSKIGGLDLVVPGVFRGFPCFRPAMRVRFADFVLDRATRQLLTKGELRALEPKAYELLDLLISRRHAAVSKQEIRDGVWPDIFVSESHLSSLSVR